MNEYPSVVKEKLTSLISEMSKDLSLYVKDPEKDFTRARKLPFETMIRLLISMGGSSIYGELLKFSDYSPDTPTTSAFIQQRDKILPHALESLLHKFTNTHVAPKTYHGYRLLAADGSALPFPANPNDPPIIFSSKGRCQGL